MDKKKQVGLFGELWVLEEVLLPVLGDRSIDLWSGPRHERHDFVGRTLRIEVKTTRKSHLVHEISRLDQLHAPPGQRLLLASVQVEETIGGQETIATRIDSIAAKLGTNGAAQDEFLTNLVRLDWSDDMRCSADLVRMEIRAVGIFAVDGQFPRLPRDLNPPSGVIDVTYNIDLSNVPMMDSTTVVALIQSEM
jgi:hypothetical protein